MGVSDPLGTRKTPEIRAGMRAFPHSTGGGVVGVSRNGTGDSESRRKVARKSPGFVVRPAVDHAGGMDADDALAWGLNLVYRSAYGLAWREVESRDQVHVRDPAKGLATLIGRITHDLGKTDAGREALEAIAEGVKDAVEGRQPRW